VEGKTVTFEPSSGVTPATIIKADVPVTNTTILVDVIDEVGAGILLVFEHHACLQAGNGLLLWYWGITCWSYSFALHQTKDFLKTALAGARANRGS